MSSHNAYSHLYNTLHREGVDRVREGRYEPDRLLGSSADQRYGLTLLWRPCSELQHSIGRLSAALQETERAQYVYPPSDWHVTVLSIVSCYPGFQLPRERVPEYMEVIGSAVQEASSVLPGSVSAGFPAAGGLTFPIRFRGVAVTPAGLVICGYPEGDVLQRLRDALRRRFRESGLEQSIDSRYSITGAHITVMRWTERLRDPEAFLRLAEDWREVDFGTCRVDALQFVYNDWYQRRGRVQEVGVIRLDEFGP